MSGMRISILALALSLGACHDGTRNQVEPLPDGNLAVAPGRGSPDEPAAALAAEPSAALVLEGEGLRAIDPRSGHATPIPFGTAEAQAVAMLAAAYGKPDARADNPDCGPGPLRSVSWNKGLTAWFQDGKFVGWGGAVDLKTADGIGFGSTRAALDAAYHPQVEETSLGTEFTAGGLSGVLESGASDAAISEIWAGATCIAR